MSSSTIAIQACRPRNAPSDELQAEKDLTAIVESAAIEIQDRSGVKSCAAHCFQCLSTQSSQGRLSQGVGYDEVG